jgi:hypothetical protein
MKTLRLIISFSLFITFFGCASAEMSSGQYFDSSKVKDIKKNITTKSNIENLFGTPFSKKISDNDEETWNYYYSLTKSEANSFLFMTKVNTEGNTKMLSISFKNNIVASYNYTETPINSYVH